MNDHELMQFVHQRQNGPVLDILDMELTKLQRYNYTCCIELKWFLLTFLANQTLTKLIDNNPIGY